MEKERENYQTNNQRLWRNKFLKQKVVAEIDSGLSVKEASESYAIPLTTILYWLKCYSKTYMVRPFFSKEERKKICQEIRSGLSIQEASLKYGCQEATLTNWLRAYEKTTSMLIFAEKKIKKMQKSNENTEIEKVQQALYEAQLKIEALEALISVAESELGISIRKKRGVKQLAKCESNSRKLD